MLQWTWCPFFAYGDWDLSCKIIRWAANFVVMFAWWSEKLWRNYGLVMVIQLEVRRVKDAWREKKWGCLELSPNCAICLKSLNMNWSLYFQVTTKKLNAYEIFFKETVQKFWRKSTMYLIGQKINIHRSKWKINVKVPHYLEEGGGIP